MDGIERCIDEEIPFEIPENWSWVRLGVISTYAHTKLKINAQNAPSDMWGLDLEDIEKIGQWIRGAKRYFLQGFVDSGALIKEGCSAHEKNTLEAFRQKALAYISSVQLRGV